MHHSVICYDSARVTSEKADIRRAVVALVLRCQAEQLTPRIAGRVRAWYNYRVAECKHLPANKNL
jgi:hypothetical protein